MFPPSYSVQPCLPSTGRRGSGAKRNIDATMAKKYGIASLQLDVMPLLSGIILLGRERHASVLHVSSSEAPVLVGLPGGNCLERSPGNFTFWIKATWLRKMWDLVLIWGSVTYVQRSVCSEGQDVNNNSTL